MYLRQSINDMEAARLVRVLKETGSWDEAKASIPDADPKMLDKGFKKWAFAKAGDLKKSAEKAAEQKPEKLAEGQSEENPLK